MPRPGPRPYECVRRAWHSDRHQPMRGTLIQEIFRMANEMHDPATRKNKEWQEKLPAVVLKAEEIMYSKANSEAEYMDLKTLHDRANDAIDTIIRKDDSIESGDLLQPCIEAALNLGCIPRRASRSQRYSNPGCYLSPTAKDNNSMKAPECSRPNIGHWSQIAPGQGNTRVSTSQYPYWCSPLFKPINGISIPEVKYNGADSYAHKDPDAKYECPFPSKSSFITSQDGLPFAMESCSSPSLGRVYPLFYSDDQSEACASQSPQNIEKSHYNCKVVLPCDQTLAKSHMVSAPHCIKKSTATAPTENSILEKMPKNTGCDLSLQLGLPRATSLHGESALANEHEDVGSNSTCEWRKFDPPLATERARKFEGLVPPNDNGFGFELLDEPLESCSNKRSSGERVFYTGARDQKRKAPASGPFNL